MGVSGLANERAMNYSLEYRSGEHDTRRPQLKWKKYSLGIVHIIFESRQCCYLHM
jgi:hypothetical protein